LSQAQGAVAADPTSALKTLSIAQSKLGDVQKNHPLDDTQKRQVAKLQEELVTQVRTAIGTYNQNAKILVLPCSTTSTNPIENTTTHTSPQTITWAQDAKGAPVLYTLAQDTSLYQIDSQSKMLGPLLPAKTAPHFLS